MPVVFQSRGVSLALLLSATVAFCLLVVGEAAPGQSMSPQKGRVRSQTRGSTTPRGGSSGMAVNPAPVLTIEDPRLAFKDVSFSHDGTRILASGWDPRERGHDVFQIWDAVTGKEIAKLRALDGPVENARLSPDGTRIASADWGGRVRVWEVATGKEVLLLKAEMSTVYGFDVSPDGRRIVTGGREKVVIWDAATGQPIRSADDSHAVQYLAYTRDGKSVVGVRSLYEVMSWDADLGKPRSSRLADVDRPGMATPAFSPDGSRLAFWFPTGFVSTGPGDAKVWDTATGKLTATLHVGKEPFRTLAFSPGGKTIVASTYMGHLQFWNADDGQEPLGFQAHASACYAAFSPDGRRLVTGGFDKAVKVWDLTKLERATPGAQRGRVKSVRVRPVDPP